MQHFKSKSFHASWVLAILAAGAMLFYIQKHYPTPTIENFPTPNPSSFNNPPPPAPNPTTSPTPKPAPSPSPSPETANTLLLKVPFTPQAPTGNWDELHNESCEEASAIMAYAYFSGMKDVTLKPEFVESELSKITEWEKQKFGYYLDINAQETATLLKEFYGLNAQVVSNYTEDGVKKALSQNRLVLILTNGRLLGNPNYKQPGPPYHMLVIRGWNSTNFITNDPGTRKGLNYPYTFQTLYNAGGDWSHNINAVDQGTKDVVVVWK